MPITVQCTHCGAQLKLKDRSKVGRKVGCPKCRKPFVIQAPATDDEFDFPDLDEFGGNYGAALPPKRAPERRRSGSGGKGKRKSSSGSGKQVLLIVLGVTGGAGVRRSRSGHFLFPAGLIGGPSRPDMPQVAQSIWIDFADKAYAGVSALAGVSNMGT